MAKVWLVFAGLALAQTSYAASGVVLQAIAAGSADPLVLSWLREVFATPLMFAIAQGIDGNVRVPVKDLKALAILGFFGVYAGQMMYIIGLFFSNAEVASIFQPLLPVLMVPLATACGQEQLPDIWKFHGAAKIVGVLCGSGGAILMLMSASEDKKKSSGEEDSTFGLTSKKLVGEGFMLLNVGCSAIYLILQKVFFFGVGAAADEATGKPSETAAGKGEAPCLVPSVPSADSPSPLLYADTGQLLEGQGSELLEHQGGPSLHDTGARAAAGLLRQRPATITAYCYLFAFVYQCLTVAGLALFSPDFTPANSHQKVSRFAVPRGAWISLVYLVLVTSCFCYCTTTWCNKHLPATVVTCFWPLQALAGCLLSLAVFGTVPSLVEMLGGVSIILGLFLVVGSNHLEMKAAEAERAAAYTALQVQVVDDRE